MREVRVTLPAEKAAEVAKLAERVGISRVMVYHALAYGSNEAKDVVSVETSTPCAKAFLEAVTRAPFFECQQCSISSRTLRAIVSNEPLAAVTRPVAEPTTDVEEELWQYSHVTFNYLGRMFVATSLVGYGMLTNNMILLAAALLFTSYLPGVLGLAFGVSTRSWSLSARSARMLITGIGVAVAGGAAVALMADGQPLPIPLESAVVTLLISLGVGAAAGLATGDDVGERQLIGLAAASQFARFPVWMGLGLVLGFPRDADVLSASGLFAASLLAMLLSAAVVYRCLGMKYLSRTDAPRRARSANGRAAFEATPPVRQSDSQVIG
jgi:hypothetical protein